MALYDESSGQVYTETVSAKVQSMIPAWTTEPAGGLRIKPSEYRHRQMGCPALQGMAMRSCLWHVDQVEPATLKSLGWHYASKIYEQLRQSKTLSFAVWNRFQRAYPDHIERDQRFRFPKSEEIPCIVDRLARLSVDMLTFLTLQSYDIQVEHLLLLLKIPTLAALMVDPGAKGVCYNITSKNIRDWGRAVRETGAFGNLAVLILNGTSSDSTALLDSLLDFPALRFLGIERKKRDKRIRRPPKSRWHDADATVSRWHEQPLVWDRSTQVPSRIWSDPGKTHIERLHLLYNLSPKTVLPSAPTAATDARVSLSFGQPHLHSRIREMNWFFKHVSPDSSSSASKRHVDEATPLQDQEGVEAGRMKKKIRVAKKTDIGSLLDSFL